MLGDIFDYWIGDGHIELDEYAGAIALFRRITARGVRVTLIGGNRDYLIGRRFEKETGIEVAGREIPIELGGRKCLLTHGDFLFNRNIRYRFYRDVMDIPPIRRLYTGFSPRIARAMALSYKRLLSGSRVVYLSKGRRGGTDDPSAARDPRVYTRAMNEAFDRGFEVVVCGHIHLPRMESFERKGGQRTLIVLGDWDGPAAYAEFSNGDFVMKRWK